MKLFIKLIACIAMGFSVLGMTVSDAQFTEIDNTHINLKTHQKDVKMWFSHDADEVYVYPKDGKLELRAKGKKTQVPTTLGEDTFYIRAYYDVNRDITLYVISARRDDYKFDTKSHDFIYRYNRQTKMWEKLVDSANYYSPYKKQGSSIQLSKELRVDQSDFMLQFHNWENFSQDFWYPLDWNDSTQRIDYRNPRHMTIDTH